MAAGKLVWDQVGQKFYEAGVDRAVLYVQNTNGTYQDGVAWNGVSQISENPSGAESNPYYADNIKYLDIISKEDFGASIECYTYPDAWMLCDGTAEPTPGVMLGQQSRRAFGLCYRTKIGNDVVNDDYGYKIHLIYNAKASPSEKSYQSIGESVEPISFSYELTTTPVNVTGYKPCSYIVIDSTKVDSAKLTQFEELIYGKDADPEDPESVASAPTLPTMERVMQIFGTSSDSDDNSTVLTPGEESATTGEG